MDRKPAPDQTTSVQPTNSLVEADARLTASPKGKKNHRSDLVDISIVVLNGEQIEKDSRDWLYFQESLKLCSGSPSLQSKDLSMNSSISHQMTEL